MSDTNALDTEFLRTEYLSLQQRLLDYIGEIRRLEKFGLLASAGSWAWISSQNPSELLLFVSWLPTAIVVCFWAKATVVRKLFFQTTAYIGLVEKQVGFSSFNLGWEHYLKKNPGTSIVNWANWFWGITLICNIFLAIVAFNTISKHIIEH